MIRFCGPGATGAMSTQGSSLTRFVPGGSIGLFRSEVVVELIEVDATANAQRRADLTEGGEVVTTVGKEVVDCDKVCSSRIERDAIQLDIRNSI